MAAVEIESTKGVGQTAVATAQGGRRRMAAVEIESVKCVVRKERAKATAKCKRGRGLIRINGCPIELLEPEFARMNAYQTITKIGKHHFDCVDMEVKAKRGDLSSKMYLIRQAIAKALVAFYTDYVKDKYQIKEIKDKINRFDGNLLVADPKIPKELGA